MLKKLLQKHRHILSYLFFGVTTTAVNWCVYALCRNVLSLEMTLSNALAWIVAVIYAFVTNKLYVFESKSLEGKLLLAEAAKFFASRALSGMVEIFLPTALFALGVTAPLFGIGGGIAKVLVSVTVVVMNYLLSRFLVFCKN